MKLIRKLLLFILIIGIILATIIGISGYVMYQDAIKEEAFAAKIQAIRQSDDYVTLDKISKDYQNAVIAVEDHRFYKHKGIDFISTGRAVWVNLKNWDIVEGGSTITQQLAKNMYFSQKQEFTRKAAELFLSFDLENHYSKNEILELYLNTIYFGNGYYGIKQASVGYLEEYPKDLTLNNATLLAGIPNAPSVYSLKENPDLAKRCV